MFFPLPPAANSTSLPTSPSPSSPGGFASIARKVSHLASGGAKQKPLPLPLHPPPTDAIDEHGKESGSGKKGRFLTLWGRLSRSPTTLKSSATPSPKETSFMHSRRNMDDTSSLQQSGYQAASMANAPHSSHYR